MSTSFPYVYTWNNCHGNYAIIMQKYVKIRSSLLIVNVLSLPFSFILYSLALRRLEIENSQSIISALVYYLLTSVLPVAQVSVTYKAP